MVCQRRRCRKPLDLWAPGRWEAAAPGNDRLRGYQISRLYSPLANIAQMVYESQATTPAALQEFKNAVLGETFVPPGGRLTLGVLDQCRRDYLMPDGCEEKTFMGVDVGIKLHVVIREPLDDEGIRTPAVFIGEVDTFDDLAELVRRYNVRGAVVDRSSGWHGVRPQRELPSGRPRLLRADRPRTRISLGEQGSGLPDEPPQALEEVFDAFETQAAEIPKNARLLGGRVRDGLGEYYRQMMALSWVLEQNSLGNSVARYLDHGKADHFAHAEAYCALALHRDQPRIIEFL